jgi:hypothetical protein
LIKSKVSKYIRSKSGFTKLSNVLYQYNNKVENQVEFDSY